MTVLVNNFEGGTTGTTITTANSGGSSGNAFDVVTNSGTGAVDIYDTTLAAHGSVSCKVSTGTSAVQSLNRWSTSIGTVPQAWFRMYVYFTAFPAAVTRIMGYATTVGTTCGTIGIGTNGKVQFFNAGGSAVITTANTVPLNAWCRIEGLLIGSATAGQMQLKFFTSMDAQVPAELLTSTATQNTTGSPGLFSFGVISNVANVAPFWMDAIGISTTGYLGPAGTPTTTKQSGFMDFFM